MPKVTLPFAEWRPDLALLDTQFASEANNVFPGANSYKPMPSLLPFTQTTLPSPAKGLTAARTLDGTWKIYAGTKTKLYVWSWAGWGDVSRTIGGNYNVPDIGELWSFAQFGDNLVAVNVNDTPQVIGVTSGTNFAALGGSPPNAHGCKVIGDFLVLYGLSANPRKIRWSAINDITGWIVGTNLCDEQEFPDGGLVKGVAGDTIGYVVQDRAIRSMQFLPGDTQLIFSFSKVLIDKGCVGEFAFNTVGNVLYFLSETGFFAIVGQQVTPIGHEKVDEYFLANSDESRRALVQCIGANRPYIMWAYHASSASPTYDRILIYDWSLDRWARAEIAATVWATLGSQNLDLDTTGAETGDALLDSTAQSLDSFAYIGGRPRIGAFDPQARLCTLDGPNLPATLETSEMHLSSTSQRTFVNDAYPLIDADGAAVTPITRERLADMPTIGSAVPLEITGSCTVFSSARLHRFRVTTEPGNVWTHGEGVAVNPQPDGSMA